MFVFSNNIDLHYSLVDMIWIACCMDISGYQGWGQVQYLYLVLVLGTYTWYLYLELVLGTST